MRLRDYLPTIPDTHSICVFVGAMAHGYVSSCFFTLSFASTESLSRRPDNFADHLVDEKVAISEYSLSASVACGKVRFPFLSLPSLSQD